MSNTVLLAGQALSLKFIGAGPWFRTLGCNPKNATKCRLAAMIAKEPLAFILMSLSTSAILADHTCQGLLVQWVEKKATFVFNHRPVHVDLERIVFIYRLAEYFCSVCT